MSIRPAFGGNRWEAEKITRIFGGNQAFHFAAEKAVPVALNVFLDSIKQMTFTDAKNILFSNQQDAATQFFRRTSEDRPREMFRPIVQDATEQVGVTRAYKQMIGRYGAFGKLVGQDASDIDGSFIALSDKLVSDITQICTARAAELQTRQDRTSVGNAVLSLKRFWPLWSHAEHSLSSMSAKLTPPFCLQRSLFTG